MKEVFVPRIHKEIKTRYNIKIDSDEIAITSLVFAIKYIGIGTFFSCGGHYEELDDFTNSDGWLYGRDGPMYPWIQLKYDKSKENRFDGIDKIAKESLWKTNLDYIKTKEDSFPFNLIHLNPDLELVDYTNKLHVQQLQLESIDLASIIIKEFRKTDVTKELDLFKEHKDLLLKQNVYLNTGEYVI